VVKLRIDFLYIATMASVTIGDVTPEKLAEMKAVLDMKVAEVVQRTSVPSMYKRRYIEEAVDVMINCALLYIKYSLPVDEVWSDIPTVASLEGLSVVNAFRAFCPVYVNMHDDNPKRFKAQYYNQTRKIFVNAILKWYEGNGDVQCQP
jgi:hypothetical protein